MIYSYVILLLPDIVVPLRLFLLRRETLGGDDMSLDGLDLIRWCEDDGHLALFKIMVQRQRWFLGARFQATRW